VERPSEPGIGKDEPVGGLNCFKCGRFLPPGSLKYVIQIKVYADFDGILSISDENGEIERILDEIGSRNPDELEREVYEEIGLLL
jgi:hypothetical protein